MKFFDPYLRLIRFNKPIGIWLLFLPCLFAFALIAKEEDSSIISFKIIFLFFLGAALIRSAGCIINDIFDRNFDRNVARTKTRPIAAGGISIFQALIFLAILLSAALLILLQFNSLTILLGISALALICLYPLAKRFSNYPQLFLGIIFNFGILLSCAASTNHIGHSIIALYLSAIFWTIIYDTFYGYQDLEDDIKIGVKSTAVSFGKEPQKILYFLAMIQIAFLILVGIINNLSAIYYLFITIAFGYLLYQIADCDFANQEDCLKKFKGNFWVGIIILIAILVG